MIPPSAGPVRYSLVIPILTRKPVLPMLLRRIDLLLDGQLDGPAEAIFVDDGSSDCSAIVLEAKAKDHPATATSGSAAISGTRSRSRPAWTPRKATPWS